MTKKFKADLTAEGALIQADYCLDQGDDAGAKRWTLIGRIQQTAERLWLKYHHIWSPTQLRRLHMAHRMRHARFEANGIVYCLEATFASAQILFTIIRVDVSPAGSELHVSLASRAIYRKTILKNPAVGLRTVAADLVRCAGL